MSLAASIYSFFFLFCWLFSSSFICVSIFSQEVQETYRFFQINQIKSNLLSLLSFAITSSMDQLPEHLLYIVLQNVRGMSKQSSFFSCLLSCRLWYDIGLPLLHNAITLRNRNLKNFLFRFQPKNLASVKHLTILSEASWDDLERQGVDQARRLQQLSKVLPGMVNLSTFSFTFRDERSHNAHPLQMPRPIITELVKNLPASVVSLEIDTDGLDWFVTHTPHLCEKLRDILPQLHHLRLRLAEVCPGVFATGFNRDGTMADEPEITPVVAPSLRTAVINCRTGNWSTGACGVRPHVVGYTPLILRLWDFATCGSFPAIEHLWVVYKPSERWIGPHWDCYKRSDIISCQTWGVPFVCGTCPSFRHFQEHQWANLVRTPEGQQFLGGDESVVEQVAEGKMWVTTLSGSRVPAAVMERWDFEYARPVPLLNLKPYRAVRSCKCIFHNLWRNETVSGCRLLGVTSRDGVMNSSPEPVICPEGFRWNRDHSKLEPLHQ